MQYAAACSKTDDSTRLALRPYQVAAAEAIETAWQDGLRAALMLPTGTGKTVIAADVISRRDERSLTLVHRDELVQQTRDKFVLAGIPESDIGVIKAELDQTQARHIIASIQTLARPRRLARLKGGVGTLWIDEAHHAAADSYLTVLEALGSAKGCGPALLGTSATWDRLDGLALGAVFDTVVYEVGLVEMIEQGYLCDVRALRVVLPMDLDCVHTRRGDLVEGELAQVFEAADGPRLVAEAFVQHARERKAAVFVPSVRLAHQTASALCGLGIASEALDAGTPTDVRRAILRRLRAGETRAVPNVGVLCEGWDEPSVDAIIMARSTESRALYQQCLGRGLRPYPGKTDCLVLDMVGNSDRHALVTTAGLLGLDPRAVEREGVLGAKVAADSAAARRDGLLRGRRPGATVVDLLGRSTLIWVQVDQAHLLSLGPDDRGHVAIEPDDAEGMWRVVRLEGEWHQPVRVLKRRLDLGYAMGLGEDLARKLVPRPLLGRDQAWRVLPPSDKQVAQFQRKGWRLPPTRGEAIDFVMRRSAWSAWRNRGAHVD
jgi:superfamily II DNA or RNA helicase